MYGKKKLIKEDGTDYSENDLFKMALDEANKENSDYKKILKLLNIAGFAGTREKNLISMFNDVPGLYEAMTKHIESTLFPTGTDPEPDLEDTIIEWGMAIESYFDLVK
jgi:hypothetical protein